MDVYSLCYTRCVCFVPPLQDIVTRYASQTGHHVSRRFGWDCHGLPVEQETEKLHSECHIG